ncbi:MAG: response regulator [Phototrophicaceae bacterium]
MPTHILLVEDEKPLREQVADMLRLEGFDVTEAEDGQAAIDLLANKRPHIILCDVAMPNMDGYEVLAHVRNTDQISSLPFIFLTARADRSFVRHGMELGADDYLTKPFTRKELLSAIDSRLARAQTFSKQSDDALETAKKQLSHMVAHELRTPLISMTMVQDVISHKLDDLSPADMRDLLGMMQSGNKRMRHLVEQMVYFTRLNTGLLSAETLVEHGRFLELDFVIQEAIQQGRSFSYRNQNGSIKRPPQKPYAPIRCLIKPLSFAIAEIIANALIYSPEDTNIIIQEHVTDPWVLLNIVDAGSGLTSNRLQKAAMPFEQIDRENQEQQGMGMGLPLAIKIVEVHGGKLDIQQTVEGGTKVVIKLPLVTV